MSQPVPPPGNPYAQGAPGQQPAGQNPFAPGAPQQPAGQNPFGQAPDGQNPFGAYPPAPAPRRNNIGLGILAAVVAALVTAGIYGAVLGGVEVEIGWAAVGVGFAVGFAAGKVGGTNPVLPIVSAVLALGAVYLGQLVGIAVFASKEFGLSFTELFFQQFGMLTDAWNEGKDAMTFLFLALGPVAAFSGARKAGASD
ncbi:hypothetical protein GCM10017562_46100 [Streptomyces roseofulvus]|uniref:Integral membrane protein n=2 Tax=Streptomyces TaxID=1883 RepID=A0ABU4K7S6_9ACTN|nr:hypothetical protein [Streptomyces roseolus]MDX2293803.1 hypothetical protein [Streptomyces roseolus]